MANEGIFVCCAASFRAAATPGPLLRLCAIRISSSSRFRLTTRVSHSILETVRKSTKVVLTALALLPLLFIFVHPSSSPGYSTLQHRVELIPLSATSLVSAALALLPVLIALRHWQHGDLALSGSAKHALLDLTCVRLC